MPPMSNSGLQRVDDDVPMWCGFTMRERAMVDTVISAKTREKHKLTFRSSLPLSTG